MHARHTEHNGFQINGLPGFVNNTFVFSTLTDIFSQKGIEKRITTSTVTIQSEFYLTWDAHSNRLVRRLPLLVYDKFCKKHSLKIEQ